MLKVKTMISKYFPSPKPLVNNKNIFALNTYTKEIGYF